MPPKDEKGIANSVDPEQSDLGVHWLPRPICPKTYGCVPMDDLAKFQPHQTEDDKNVIVFGL